jgi:hypothetical protein
MSSNAGVQLVPMEQTDDPPIELVGVIVFLNGLGFVIEKINWDS